MRYKITLCVNGWQKKGRKVMIRARVEMSRETEKQYMIDQLNRLGIYETVKVEDLRDVGYYNLRSMLAAARAVRV